jgi:hypothetical protein
MSLVLANKFLSEESLNLTSKKLSKIGGLKVKEINKME